MAKRPSEAGAPVAPSRAQQGVNTAPTLSGEDEVAELRAEVARLRALLGEQEEAEGRAGDVAAPAGGIPYHRKHFSGARLTGITKAQLKAGRVRETTDFPYLPKPETDLAQLEHDFVRWGYCIVRDALSPAQVAAQVERLADQAAAERAARVADMSGRDRVQTVGNLVAKGQVFRDIVALEPAACQGGHLVEAILGKALGKGWYLGTAHGSIVHQGGGLQDLHQDQGYVPLPHPPYPLAVLIIWTLSDFSLAEGGTFVVPGSHIDADGGNRVKQEAAFEKLVEGEPGLCALRCPAGQCYVMDARVLHSGGTRTAPGKRYALRNLYMCGFMRQQENMFLGVPDDVILASSWKLRALMGFRPYQGLGMVNLDSIDPQVKRVPLGELSMSRPEEFGQDFDIKHSAISEFYAKGGSAYRESRPSRWLHPRPAKL